MIVGKYMIFPMISLFFFFVCGSCMCMLSIQTASGIKVIWHNYAFRGMFVVIKNPCNFMMKLYYNVFSISLVRIMTISNLEVIHFWNQKILRQSWNENEVEIFNVILYMQLHDLYMLFSICSMLNDKYIMLRLT